MAFQACCHRIQPSCPEIVMRFDTVTHMSFAIGSTCFVNLFAQVATQTLSCTSQTHSFLVPSCHWNSCSLWICFSYFSWHCLRDMSHPCIRDELSPLSVGSKTGSCNVIMQYLQGLCGPPWWRLGQGCSTWQQVSAGLSGRKQRWVAVPGSASASKQCFGT